MQTHLVLIAAGAGLMLALSPAAAVQALQHGPGGQKPAATVVQPAPAALRIAACAPDDRSAGCAKGGARKSGGISVGQIVDPAHAHMITHPGRYGLSNAPGNNRYAVVAGKLVRIDEESGKILSILRSIDRILD